MIEAKDIYNFAEPEFAFAQHDSEAGLSARPLHDAAQPADVQGFTRSSLASADSQQSEIVEQQDPQGEGEGKTASVSRKRGRKPRPDANERRKVQNRKAQKTFRERRKGHVKHLEHLTETMQGSVGAAFTLLQSLLEENNKLKQADGDSGSPRTIQEVIQNTPLALLYAEYSGNGVLEQPHSATLTSSTSASMELFEPYSPNLSADSVSPASTSLTNTHSDGAPEMTGDFSSQVSPALTNFPIATFSADSLQQAVEDCAPSNGVFIQPQQIAQANSIPSALVEHAQAMPSSTSQAFKFDPTLMPTPPVDNWQAPWPGQV